MIPEVTLLCVEDNSDDGTEQFLNELKEANPNLKVINRVIKSGVASALVLGMRYGYEKKFDWVICMDADLSHRIQDLSKLVRFIEENPFKAELIIGSRYVSEGKTQGVQITRKLISRFGNLMGRISIGCDIRDVTSGFRAYSRKALNEIVQTRISQGGYGFQLQILKRINERNLVIHEIPITYENRIFGKSKLTLQIVFETLRTCILLFLERFFVDALKLAKTENRNF
jgi:dolichol-phosphate mannosyltransferase